MNYAFSLSIWISFQSSNLKRKNLSHRPSLSLSLSVDLVSLLSHSSETMVDSRSSKRARAAVIRDDVSASSSSKRARAAVIRDDVSGASSAPALNSIHLDEMGKKNPELMRRLNSFIEAENQLKVIHADILKKERSFVLEREKWVNASRHRFTDMNQFFEERCQWELNFKKFFLDPLYKKIRSIVAATSVLCFWLEAMLSRRIIRKQLSDEDVKALKFLKNVESSRTSNFKGFELKFTFDNSNPYFKNEVLTKKYEVTGDENDSVSLKAIGDKIEWYPSQNLTENKRGKRIESFFNFFKSYATVDPLSFDIETDKLKGDLPEDYEIGITFRDKIIPHAVSCFNCDDDSDYGDEDDCDDGDQLL